MLIENKANQLLVKAGIITPPVQVEKVAAYLNIKIERVDLGEDCSGVLVRNADSAIIGVNEKHHLNRQRFSIAHEIGHFILHEGDTYIDKGYRVLFRDLESGSGSKGEEMDANAFAAALLMPAEWVKDAFFQQPFDLTEDYVLQMLANKFKVSIQAMSYRLMRLRIF